MGNERELINRSRERKYDGNNHMISSRRNHNSGMKSLFLSEAKRDKVMIVELWEKP